jgi:hypothetical protein
VTQDAWAAAPLQELAESTLGPYVFAVLAGLAGFAINLLGLPVLGGTEVVFGGLLSLFIAFRFGGLPGGLTAAVAFAATWLRWGHPMGMACYTAEAAVAGWLVHGRQVRPLRALLAYWIVLGVPAIAIYMYLDRSFPFPGYLAIIVKYPLNTLLVVGPVLALLEAPFLAQVTTGRAKPAAPPPLRRVLADRFGALAVAPLVVLTLVFGHLFDRTLRQRAMGDVASDARRTATGLSAFLEEHRRAIESLARVLSPRGSIAAGETPALLESLREEYPAFVTMLVAGRDGVVVAAAGGTGGPPRGTAASVADRDEFRRAIEDRVAYTSGVLRGRELGRDLVVAVSAPVLDVDGLVRSVVEGSFDLEPFRTAALRASGTAGREVLVVDQHNRVVAASQGMRLSPMADVTRHPVVAMGLDAATGFTFDLAEQEGARAERCIGATHPVPGFGWRVSVLEPIWNAQRLVAAFYVAAFLCACLAVAGVRLFARRLADGITRPLSRLAWEAGALAHGDAVQPEPGAAGPARELEEIEASLRAAALTLSRSNAELRQVVEERDRTQEELRDLLWRLDRRDEERRTRP